MNRSIKLFGQISLGLAIAANTLTFPVIAASTPWCKTGQDPRKENCRPLIFHPEAKCTTNTSTECDRPNKGGGRRE